MQNPASSNVMENIAGPAAELVYDIIALPFRITYAAIGGVWWLTGLGGPPRCGKADKPLPPLYVADLK
jgi:hypothetical protein